MFTSLKASTELEKAFSDYVQPCVQRHHVTLGGVSANVVGKGTLNVLGLLKLTDVWLVEGLKTNLISISQLIDQELCVRFNKNKCLIVDESDTCVMGGVDQPTIVTFLFSQHHMLGQT